MTPDSWWDTALLAAIGLACAALILRRVLRVVAGKPAGGCPGCAGACGKCDKRSC